MDILAVLSGLLLVGLAVADPVPQHDDVTTITKTIFKDEYVVYTGDNDITKIVIPLNSINFNEKTDLENMDIYVFFIETGKGLFVLKNGVATKLLENGKDIASSAGDSTKVFFGATDGIYTFNAETKTAEKYGTLTDNIRNILVTNTTDDIYILTEDKTFYKVLEEGTKKEEVTNVKDAEQVAFDPANNLFFTDSKKRLYVKNFETDIVKKVKGLPPNPIAVEIIRPPGCFDEGVMFVSGKKVYGISASGQSQFAELVLNEKPTAIAIEATLELFFAYDKKIYQFNVIELLASTQENMAPVKSYINKKAPNLKELAKKKTFREY